MFKTSEDTFTFTLVTPTVRHFETLEDHALYQKHKDFIKKNKDLLVEGYTHKVVVSNYLFGLHQTKDIFVLI